MKKVKLSTLTERQLKKIKVVPVDVEDRTQELLDDCFPKIKLLDKYEYSQGSLIRQTDKILFRECCLDNQTSMVSDKLWLDVEGEIYDVSEVIEAFEEAGVEVIDADEYDC